MPDRLDSAPARGAGPILEFAGFRFDPDRGLSHAGRPIHLSRKELRGLGSLLAKRGAVATREEYTRAAWRGGDASENSIARSIHLLRRALGAVEGTEVVETVHGFGYRVTVEVREVQPNASSTAAKTVNGVNPAAFETFQLAREFLARRTPADLEAAVRLFRHAAELGGDYAAAWAAIADCRINQAMRWYVAPQRAGQLAVEAAERALAIDPGAASALAARGWVCGVIRHSVRPGLSDLERAIALDPQYWLARVYRAWLLPALGEYGEALAEARIACLLNPLHPVPRSLVGWLLFCSGRTGEALETLRSSADELCEPRQILRVLAVVSAWAGECDEAIAIGRRVEAAEQFAPDGTTALAYALARAGDAAAARRVVRQWRDEVGAHPPLTHMAAVYLELGDAQQAAEAWRNAQQQSCPHFVFAGGDPRLAALRTEEFAAAKSRRTTSRAGEAARPRLAEPQGTRSRGTLERGATQTMFVAADQSDQRKGRSQP